MKLLSPTAIVVERGWVSSPVRLLCGDDHDGQRGVSCVLLEVQGRSVLKYWIPNVRPLILPYISVERRFTDPDKHYLIDIPSVAL